MKTKTFFSWLFISVFFITVCTSCFLKTQKTTITKEQLPKNAQTFIHQYFNNKTISYIIKDDEFFKVEYDVRFIDNSNIEFNTKGEWEEINNKGTIIPNSFIISGITTYINSQFPGTGIIKIEKDGSKYEVKISNGLELEFSKSGRFLKID